MFMWCEVVILACCRLTWKNWCRTCSGLYRTWLSSYFFSRLTETSERL